MIPTPVELETKPDCVHIRTSKRHAAELVRLTHARRDARMTGNTIREVETMESMTTIRGMMNANFKQHIAECGSE